MTAILTLAAIVVGLIGVSFAVSYPAYATTDNPESVYKQVVTARLDTMKKDCHSNNCAKAAIIVEVRPQIDVIVQASIRICRTRIEKGEWTFDEGIRICDQFQGWTEDAIAEWLAKP